MKTFRVLERYERLREEIGMEMYLQPSGVRENAETAISCGGPGPARKKRGIPPVVVGRRNKMRGCALVVTQRELNSRCGRM